MNQGYIQFTNSLRETFLMLVKDGQVRSPVLEIFAWAVIVIFIIYYFGSTSLYRSLYNFISSAKSPFLSRKSWNRKMPRWGKVHSILAQRPIEGILIKVYSSEGELIATQLSGIGGNFGFDLLPGRYFLEIESRTHGINYLIFGTKKSYRNEIVIKNDSRKFKMDIYLDNLISQGAIDVDNIRNLNNILIAFYFSLELVLVIGTINALFSWLVLHYLPIYIALVFVIFWVVVILYRKNMFLLNILIAVGVKPIEGVAITVRDSSGKILSYLGTDSRGRARQLLPQGKYRLEILNAVNGKIVTGYYPLNKNTDKKRILISLGKTKG
ncbi:hypothetical protein COT77_01155 [Candidatus Berkelbacteria bacterium CG10_big_fil_rev_8_21_14_0_10_41_12]|uniref:Carboxypeptidase regulatory-like domain-containing protein n=1 Tax=Candidatus Berkelbacteria bacterium CG10_big_fil_rev_8_21_14_0_10_41_12 TaxID=1974513 RepID=A0A2M6WXH9_9BACT|nr:MAG: hypothetical protein COT77_01155 [Candidatus Berkelbacteria bacterium CG10_big_fil_rev_8_21_14_0_10_41_12]